MYADAKFAYAYESGSHIVFVSPLAMPFSDNNKLQVLILILVYKLVFTVYNLTITACTIDLFENILPSRHISCVYKLVYYHSVIFPASHIALEFSTYLFKERFGIVVKISLASSFLYLPVT